MDWAFLNTVSMQVMSGGDMDTTHKPPASDIIPGSRSNGVSSRIGDGCRFDAVFVKKDAWSTLQVVCAQNLRTLTNWWESDMLESVA